MALDDDVLALGGNLNYFDAQFVTGTGAALEVVTAQNQADIGAFTIIKKFDGSGPHYWFDTERGVNKYLQLNDSAVEVTLSDSLTAFNNNGFSLGDESAVNNSGDEYLILSVLKFPGFCDMGLHTGNGTNNRAIAHDMAAPPAMKIIKSIAGAPYAAVVGHTALTTSGHGLLLDSDAAEGSSYGLDSANADTAANFYVDSQARTNGNSINFIHVLLAVLEGHSSAGGYSEDSGSADIATGLDDVSAIITKRADGTGDWYWFVKIAESWHHIKLNSTAAGSTGLISNTGGDVTLSGAAASGSGIWFAFR